MGGFHRRELLRAALASGPVLAGTGQTMPNTGLGRPGRSIPASSETDSQADWPVLTRFSAQATGGRIAIDTDDPTDATAFDTVDIPDGNDYVIACDGELLRTGVWRTDELEIVNFIDVIRALDVKAELLGAIETLDLEGVVAATDLETALEWAVGGIENLDVDDPADERLQDALDAVDDLVRAISGAFVIEVGLSTVESILFDGVESADPQSLEELVVEPSVGVLEIVVGNLSDVLGVLFGADDLTTESDEFESLVNELLQLVGFENVGELESLVVGLLESVDEAVIDEALALFDAGIAVETRHGVFDPRFSADDEVRVTADVSRVTVRPGLPGVILGSEIEPAFGHDPVEVELGIELAFTTGESGGAAGAVMIGENGSPTTLTLVENEFTIEVEQVDIGKLVDGFEIPELLALAFELRLVDEFFDDASSLPETVFDDIAAFLRDAPISGLVSALELESMIGTQLTDDPGRHLLELDVTVEFERPLDMEALKTGLPEDGVVSGLEPPRDRTGDGLFEDVTGDGELGIQDVQVLFDAMAEIPDTQAPGYNFSGVDPATVTIFDIQALFNRYYDQPIPSGPPGKYKRVT